MTLLTISEAALRLRVSTKTVRREIADGRIPIVAVGSARMVYEHELEKYIAAASVQTQQRQYQRKLTKAEQRKATGTLIPLSQIIEKARPYASSVGIYFLIDGEEVVYVGQSVNVFARISQHKSEGKKFERWCFLPCSAEQLHDTERRYIEAIAPALNQAFPEELPSTMEDLQRAVERLSFLVSPDVPLAG